MSRKLTKNLFESVQAKLDAATAAVTGDKGKSKHGKGTALKRRSSSKKGKGANKTASAAAAAVRPKRKVPSTAEERVKRNVSLLKKLGAHRIQAQVLKKVMATR